VEKNKNELVKKLKLLKKQGKSVAGFGAPAKGNTMLNYFNIDTKLIDFIVDDSPLKQGLYTPGTHIKVVESDVMYDKMPDYVLILAWNFAKPIMKAHKKYKIGGGKFIVPVPKLKMV